MNFYQSIRAQAKHCRRSIQFGRIYSRFRDFTMIPREMYVNNLLLAERVKRVPGCVVECGVWRGGMSAGIASMLGPARRYFLYDSFDGLPPAKAIDGQKALEWQKNTQSPNYHDNCSAPPEFARRAMTLAGATSFELVQGWFHETLPGKQIDGPIALLRLDGDWYESTMICLEHLFDQVTPGGLVILDDYYAWDGCSRALHDFLSRRSAVERVRNLGNFCYLEKRPQEKELLCA